MSDAATAESCTPSDLRIEPRNLTFVRTMPDERFWAKGDPVETHYFNAMSLTFPEGERFFIDAVKHFRNLATGKLAEDVKNFIIQESLHTREHLAFNKFLDPEHYPIAEIEAFIAKRIGIGRSRPPVAHLAITAALEHFTAIFAEDALKHADDFGTRSGPVRDLWMWHALEESEHKAVAFDVLMRAIAGWPAWRRYVLRVHVMLVTTILFNMNVGHIALRLLDADGIKGWRARWKLLGFMVSSRSPYRRTIGAYLSWYLPGYHPWWHDTRPLMTKWRERFGGGEAQAA
ncbi:MAG: metal-dependent hydrolase [Alphaproteobacteria bacterium]|nr:metal-dependent hydrolase [Alphaproteobacteria bacterium]